MKHKKENAAVSAKSEIDFCFDLRMAIAALF